MNVDTKLEKKTETEYKWVIGYYYERLWSLKLKIISQSHQEY